MKKLFGNSSQEDAVKQSLLSHLSDTVKQIQYFYIQDNELGKSEDLKEAFTSLCTTLEAMFLHGLRDSISRRLRRAIADIDERPEPNFWPPLLMISHRQIIEQISNLSQINTDIGKCRAWIRIALNDGLLSSYFSSIRRDTPWKSFYQTDSFLRDPELLELAQKLLESVEEFKTCALPYNSSILNVWTAPSLCMAGIWAPTMKASPVAPCDDVASLVDEPKNDSFSDNCSLSSAMSVTSLTSGLRQIVALNEDEALKTILGKSEQTDANDSKEEKEVVPQGNCLSQGGWSSDNPKSQESSFNALLESYNQSNPSAHFDLSTIKREETPIDSEQIYNAVPLSELICTLSREQGIDPQNHRCASCEKSLSITSNTRVCAFSSEYFCDSCMSEHSMKIPAHIIHNWDFKTYPVSKRTYNYLNEIRTHPIIDFKVVNPSVYNKVKEMEQLLVLRKKLNFIRAYLYTCKEPIIEELKKKMSPRTYMYEHTHLYSFADLCDIPTGVLAQQLQSVVDFGRDHVIKCWLCSQKGFLCEICSRSQPLFPFDMENVYRCEDCNAVYHKDCMNATKPCPKCKRKRDRDDLLGATVD